MHIADGVLTTEVWASGWALGGGAVALALRGYDDRRLPELGVLTSVFFVASCVHVPVPPATVHLQLSALVGIVLGRLSYPAVLVALFLQYILFGHGGLLSLGANTTILGTGALASGALFRALGGGVGSPGRAAVSGFVATQVGIVVSAAIFVAAMAASGKALGEAALLTFLLVYLPVALVEGVVVGATALFLRRVRPALLVAEGSPP